MPIPGAQNGEVRTVSQCVDRFTKEGYTDWFKVDASGLHAVTEGRTHAPETMRIDDVARFEGITDPDDEAIVFALRCEHGVKGTYTVPYGPRMPAADAEIVRHLEGRTNAAMKR
jgi:hypothetical protein